MEFENLLEVIKKRRTIRKYMPEPIPDDYIDKVIDAARWAPSGANTQPWEFVIVKDQEVKKQMGLTVSGAVARGNEGTVSPQPYFEGAPVLIVVCGDPRLMEAYPKGLTHRYFSVKYAQSLINRFSIKMSTNGGSLRNFRQ